MQKLQTFEQCCAALGYDSENCLPDVSRMPKHHQSAATAIAKLYIIAEALNEGWKPNWNDYDERKWVPWFYLDAPGCLFFVSRYVFSASFSAGGSRLCFVSEEISDFAADTYKDLWSAAMLFE